MMVTAKHDGLKDASSESVSLPDTDDAKVMQQQMQGGGMQQQDMSKVTSLGIASFHRWGKSYRRTFLNTNQAYTHCN